MLANYHTHTNRCHHAWGEDKEYVEAAIRSGMKVLGFSDHCPWIYDDGHVSHTRMLPSQLDEYFTSLQRLRDEYKNDIRIYIGFESEYIPEQMEAQAKLFEGYPIDYMILGEHFTAREPFGPYTGFPDPEEAALAKYVDLCIEGMETGLYRYVAHPDLMNFSGDPAIYDKHYRRLCEYLKAHDIPVEINLLGAVEGRHYPSPQFFRITQEVGNSAIIGVDAHTPDRLEHSEGMAACRRIAEEYHLPLVEFLEGLE